MFKRDCNVVTRDHTRYDAYMLYYIHSKPSIKVTMKIRNYLQTFYSLYKKVEAIEPHIATACGTADAHIQRSTSAKIFASLILRSFQLLKQPPQIVV